MRVRLYRSVNKRLRALQVVYVGLLHDPVSFGRPFALFASGVACMMAPAVFVSPNVICIAPP